MCYFDGFSTEQANFIVDDPGTGAVLEALEGDIPVIAAVKHRFDVPFLNAVRAMPKAKRYTVTPESWEALYEELLPLLRQWNRAGQSF